MSCKKQRFEPDGSFILSPKKVDAAVEEEAVDPIANVPMETEVELDAEVVESLDGGFLSSKKSNKTIVSASDASVKQAAESIAEANTKKAIDQALNNVKDPLKQCYDRSGSPSIKSNIKLRVHSSGYVIDAEAIGGGDEVQSCLNNVLRGVKVEGVQSGTITLERTLIFSQGQ